MGKSKIIHSIILAIFLLHPIPSISQTPPEMVYDLKHSDIKVLEISKDIAVMYGGIGKLERNLIEKLGTQYNLKITLIALPMNKYISNVEISIL